MYSDIKKVSRTKNYLLDAIQAVSDETKSSYFKEGLELVGVNLDTDFLKVSQVIADPYLSVNLEDDVGITIDIRLKPEDEDDPLLDILELVMERTDTGMFQGFKELSGLNEKEEKEVAMLSSMFLPQTAREKKSDPLVTLFFDKDSIELQKFKLLGEDYYAFSLTERAQLDEEVYEHTLNILLKDRNSTFETFFSAFVGEDLGKRETHRILESISQNNITGMFIGGASLKTPYINSLTYAYTSANLIYNPEEKMVTVRTGETSYSINLSNLKDTEVRVNEVGKYTLSLQFSRGIQLDIFIG